MDSVLQFLETLLTKVPLEVFVAIGTATDELISPIPVVAVLLPAGAAAQLQSIPAWYLVVLALISGGARAIAGCILYGLGKEIEHVALHAHGKRRIFGVSHQQIQRFSAKLHHAQTSKAWIALFAMHAIPIFPGALLSLGSGFIRLKMILFLTATAAGSTISALFYLHLGYAGIQAVALSPYSEALTYLSAALVLAAIAFWALYLYKKRHHTT